MASNPVDALGCCDAHLKDLVEEFKGATVEFIRQLIKLGVILPGGNA